MAKPVKRSQKPGNYSAEGNLIEQFNALRADVAALKAAFDGHVHGGVTAGGANTAGAANSPALTSDTLDPI